jgi:2-methylcitrate dehydratase PrpD
LIDMSAEAEVSDPRDAHAHTLRSVADFVLTTTPDDIPDAILERAGLLFLDTIGICAAAAPMEAGLIGRDAAALLYGAGSRETTARLLFDGRPVSLGGAVFASATQIDNMDGHDGFNPVKGHIGVVAVPTLAALAEHAPSLSGRDALAALVVGYEIAGRAGISLHASATDYHTSGAWNALGVAAMAARMRGLSAGQLREALGIAEYHGPRSQMMREIANPTMLHDGSGWGALAGMSAAILAERGFTGAPAVTIEAPEAAPHWADLGAVWWTGAQYLKPYPVCRWAHAAIDAAADLCTGHDLRAEDIKQIRIRSFNNAVELFPGMPETTSQAQYSLPFAVAAWIANRRIGLAEISGDGLDDPRVARLVARTRTVPDPRHEARFPEGRWADVSFTLTDGRTLDSGERNAHGGPSSPFTADEITEKYLEFAAPALGRARVEALRDAVLALARADGPFSDVAAHLYDPL